MFIFDKPIECLLDGYSLSIIPITIFTIVIISILIISEHLVWKKNISVDFVGGLVKLIIISILAFAPYWISNNIDLFSICGLSIVAISLIYQLNMFRPASVVRVNYRHLIIMFSSYILLVILLLERSPRIFLLAMLIPGIAGSLSDIIGDRFGKSYIQLTSEKKSTPGLIIFTVLTTLLLLLADGILNSILPGFNSTVNLDYFNILLVLSIAIIVTSFKAISSKGWENFYIPVSAAILLFIFSESPSKELLIQFYSGVFIAAVIASISYKLKFLTASGSVATFLLASFIFGLGGLQWSIPIMAFFILSSLLSNINKKSNNSVEDYFEKTGVRDHFQVLANGGLGGILVILYYLTSNEMFFLIYLASLSAVCADTWATEIGTMWDAKTYNIINLKPVQQGVSGGISVIGSLGALFGAIIIALSGYYWFNENFLLYFLIVIIAGISGSFFDSLLGATIQVQFECSNCSKITEKNEHCGKTTKPVRGFNWITNDIVNILAAAAGIFVTYFIWNFWN